VTASASPKICLQNLTVSTPANHSSSMAEAAPLFAFGPARFARAKRSSASPSLAKGMFSTHPSESNSVKSFVVDYAAQLCT
jgi:hypothetical protein